MSERKIILQGLQDAIWGDLAEFRVNERYSLTRKQRNELNELKYDLGKSGIEVRILKRFEKQVK